MVCRPPGGAHARQTRTRGSLRPDAAGRQSVELLRQITLEGETLVAGGGPPIFPVAFSCLHCMQKREPEGPDTPHATLTLPLVVPSVSEGPHRRLRPA